MTPAPHWYRISLLTWIAIAVCTVICLEQHLIRYRTVQGIDVRTEGWPIVTNWWFSGQGQAWPNPEVDRAIRPFQSYLPDDLRYSSALNIVLQIALTLAIAGLVEYLVRRRSSKSTEQGPLRWHQISLMTLMISTAAAGVFIGLNARKTHHEIVGVTVCTRGWPWAFDWNWCDRASLARWQKTTSNSNAPFTEVMNTLQLGYHWQHEINMAYDLFVAIAGTAAIATVSEKLLRAKERRA